MVNERNIEHESGTSGDQFGRELVRPVEPTPDPEAPQPVVFERREGNAEVVPGEGGIDKQLVFPEPEPAEEE